MAKASTSTKPKHDLHQEVTNSIIAALSDGQLPWLRPGAGFPTNRTTGKAYHGLNVILLWLRANQMGFATDRWMTFNQGKALGAQVRKGEKGVHCIKYTIIEKKEKDATGKDAIRRIPYLSSFVVFNECQFDDLPELKAQDLAAAEADLVHDLMQTGAAVRVDSRIRYDEASDIIQIPTSDAFETPEMYAATLGHLFIHWTGATSRLKREVAAKPGLNAHAFEEMVAEMGAAFLCAEYGIPSIAHHAEMVKDWLEVLEADKTSIFKAASLAGKAVDFIHEQRQAKAAAA